ncbi:3-oxoacyl-[acyl-carrier-protein] reductase FabG [Latimeria chalumnae]|uniref:Zgc:101858 n=1 Tax=Latimeria chalumnae TaxID=7897 RepID=H3B6E8_LATCH|nr:PREDICTED: 3-oxoacyl-[acyl-carrier-protein] reductase FabG-like [Latimeria chalumnae]|eukprot:XP_005994410.1 PREDICTED: 3-oxoacyl-[acyl-carrier-protein] reductase FabG-like [Latimeria chalumnae]
MAQSVHADEGLLSLKGKVALITGASSGIGAATSILFAKLGARLALNGRNMDNLTKIAHQCEEASKEKPLLVPGDLTEEGVVKKTIADTIAHYSQLDILVNNAGILETGSIENTTMEQYDKVMNINMRSVYELTTLAVPHLIKTKGNVINVSSICGPRSFSGLLAYCVSKSALDQFTRCVALELASKQVRVNAVCPGVIITEIHKRAGLNEGQYAEFLEHSKETHALGRPGKADEVAQGIAFLAAETASFITGVTLPIDGGRHAMCPR